MTCRSYIFSINLININIHDLIITLLTCTNTYKKLIIIFIKNKDIQFSLSSIQVFMSLGMNKILYLR